MSQLRFRERGAHLCHHVGKPGLVGLHHVHVSLDDDALILVADGLPCQVQSKQRLALVEERGPRRVDVLGHPLRVERSRPKADHASLYVPNGDHEPVAEAVVGAAAVLALYQQPGLYEFFDAVSALGQVGPRPLPTWETVAHQETLDRLVA